MKKTLKSTASEEANSNIVDDGLLVKVYTD